MSISVKLSKWSAVLLQGRKKQKYINLATKMSIVSNEKPYICELSDRRQMSLLILSKLKRIK